MSLMYQQFASGSGSHSSPKLATSPHHHQVSPLPSPAHFSAPSPGHGGDTSGSDAGDAPLNLSKPRGYHGNRGEGSRGRSSAAGSPSPSVQPPPAHSKNRLAPPELGAIKAGFPPGFVPNPYMALGHVGGHMGQGLKPQQSPPPSSSSSSKSSAPAMPDRVRIIIFYIILVSHYFPV